MADNTSPEDFPPSENDLVDSVPFEETVEAVDGAMDLLLLAAKELTERLPHSTFESVIKSEWFQIRSELPTLGNSAKNELVRRHLLAVKDAADVLQLLLIGVNPPEGHNDVSPDQEETLMKPLRSALRTLYLDTRAET
jgi:hypothetical protein